MKDHGYEKGDRCNRNGCQGIIEEHEKRGCSCHINPPCSACTEARGYCPVCEWEERDDLTVKDWDTAYIGHNGGMSIEWKPRVLDRTKIDYVITPYSNSSQICEGVYPKGTTREDVREKVIGSFGGRFEYFDNGKFKYVAYTD